MVTDTKGKVVTSIRDLGEGQVILTKLKDGMITSEINQLKEHKEDE
jgi:exonuclease VII large subunit